MDVSNSVAPASAQIYVMKKSQDIAKRDILGVLDSATTQSSAAQTKNFQESTAQKTGLGQSLDLFA